MDLYVGKEDVCIVSFLFVLDTAIKMFQGPLFRYFQQLISLGSSVWFLPQGSQHWISDEQNYTSHTFVLTSLLPRVCICLQAAEI